MSTSPLSPHVASPAELQERIAAERDGRPFVVYRSPEKGQSILALGAGDAVTIGRDDDCRIRIDWDSRVSGLHAELSRLGSHWIVVDDGLSTNGTFLNGERVVGRRRLHDRDELSVGDTTLVFRDPARDARRTTLAGSDHSAPELSPAQHRVLVALCRPHGEDAAYARPARNQEIADELHLTVAAVKTHLRTLFQRFGLEDLPQNEKRARLVQAAFESGAVSPGELHLH
jgi:pSer/pThr/pTyr-binding forkhead associated (FHA) protein